MQSIVTEPLATCRIIIFIFSLLGFTLLIRISLLDLNNQNNLILESLKEVAQNSDYQNCKSIKNLDYYQSASLICKKNKVVIQELLSQEQLKLVQLKKENWLKYNLAELPNFNSERFLFAIDKLNQRWLIYQNKEKTLARQINLPWFYIFIGLVLVIALISWFLPIQNKLKSLLELFKQQLLEGQNTSFLEIQLVKEAISKNSFYWQKLEEHLVNKQNLNEPQKPQINYLTSLKAQIAKQLSKPLLAIIGCLYLITIKLLISQQAILLTETLIFSIISACLPVILLLIYKNKANYEEELNLYIDFLNKASFEQNLDLLYTEYLKRISINEVSLIIKKKYLKLKAKQTNLKNYLIIKDFEKSLDNRDTNILKKANDCLRQLCDIEISHFDYQNNLIELSNESHLKNPEIMEFIIRKLKEFNLKGILHDQQLQ